MSKDGRVLLCKLLADEGVAADLCDEAVVANMGGLAFCDVYVYNISELCCQVEEWEWLALSDSFFTLQLPRIPFLQSSALATVRFLGCGGHIFSDEAGGGKELR